MEYDENTVLRDYVWVHGQEYMTDVELLAQKVVFARLKAESSDPKMSKRILEKWGSVDDSRVSDLLSHGVEHFQESLRNRILNEHPGIVNRCPNCNKVVKTPKARQCRWCLHDWHSKT